MRQEKLSELLDISIGRTPSRNEPAYWGTGHRWVSIRDLNSKTITETKEQITDLAVEKARCKIVRKGTLLFSFKLTIGKMAFAGCDLFTNEAIAAFRIKDDRKLNPDFLYYALQSATFGGSNQAVMGKTLNSKSLAEIEIPLPSLDDQIRIAHLLGKVEGLIAQRKQHLQQLDDLLNSVFLEMFGDIRAQKSSHPWEALRPYLKANSGKSSKNVIADKETGIPIFGGNGINGWAVETLYDTPVVIAGRVGQQCGVIHLSKGPCWVTDNAIVLSIVDDKKLNIVYLAKAFHYAPIRERVKQLDLPFINQSMLLDYLLPLPPIELQEQFAAIVEKIEGIKILYQQSLVDLETLYGALSQQAFKGELDLSRVPMPDIEPEEEKTVAAEPLHPTSEQGPAINLPDTDHSLAALESTEAREGLFSQWLEAYRGQLGSTPFSVQHFMAAAQTRLAELHPDNDFELGVNDYEHIKAWVFEALTAGRLHQSLDITAQDENGEPVLGNLIELKSGGQA